MELCLFDMNCVVRTISEYSPEDKRKELLHEHRHFVGESIRTTLAKHGYNWKTMGAGRHDAITKTNRQY